MTSKVTNFPQNLPQWPDDKGIFSPLLLDDPYPYYLAVQASNPIYFDELQKAWIVTRFDDVIGMLKNATTFSSSRPVTTQIGTLGQNFILFSHDPPEHTRLRALLSRPFLSHRLKSMEPWIVSECDSLLDALPDGKVDIATALATPLPIKVIAKLLGLNEAGYLELKKWTEWVVGHNIDAGYQSGRVAFLRLHQLFQRTTQVKRIVPEDDLISYLIDASENAGLSDQDIVNTCLTLLVAGNETTASLISNLLALLAQSPDLWSILRDNRSLIDAYIDESLRLESPIQFISRIVAEPVNVRGCKMEPGETVFACIGAANRDPLAFKDPNVFDLQRKPIKHLAFSHGIHYCIGALLTRMETRIVLNKMLDRYHSLRLVEPGKRFNNIFFRGYQQLIITMN